MNYLPPRPSGSSRFALFVQALWDIIWGTESIFVSTPDGPLKFEKLANGKYNPILKPRGGGGGTPSAGGWRGGWSNTATYSAGDIVVFTPESGQAGTYGCDLDPPVDTAPDTGAPYWTAFPLQSPSVWA